MIDFLRSNTWCSREEYLWEMTVAQVRLASADFSHVDYSGKHKKGSGKTRIVRNAEQIRNTTDLGEEIVKNKQGK